MLILLFTTTSYAATTTIVVDAAGTGDYTELSDALAAAPEDVRIEIRPGAYTLEDVFWVGQTFEMVGAGAQDVTIYFNGLDAALGVLFQVSATISDVSFEADPALGEGTLGLTTYGHATPSVTIERARFHGYGTEVCVFTEYMKSLIVSESTFEDCDRGIQFASVTGVIENNLFLGNNSGIESFEYDEGGSSLDVQNNTFVGNGGHFIGSPNMNDVSFTDNIFVGATGYSLGTYPPYDAADWHLSNNLFWDNGTCYSSDCVDWGSDIIEADPLFVDWSDDGDWTNDDLQLLPGSPAIDAAVGTSVLIDREGAARPLDGDGDGIAIADLGAYEMAEPTIPGDTGDPDTGEADADTDADADSDTDADGDADADADGDADGDADTDPTGDTGSNAEPPKSGSGGDACGGCASSGFAPTAGLLALPLLLLRRRRVA